MAFTRKDYIDQITFNLATLRTFIESENSSGYYDANKYAENFYAGLLNRVYGWNLKNANTLHRNAPGIDLIDEENEIVVQVSSTNTTTKIHKTIEACKKYPLNLEGFHLIMLFIIGKKAQYSPDFDVEGFLAFDKENDIWDNQTILNKLQEGMTPVKGLKEVDAFLNEELTRNNLQQKQDPVSPNPYMKDCTEEYSEKCNKPLFLNNAAKDPRQVTILQKELFVEPKYSTKGKRAQTDILAFMETTGGKLILGHPGIGKTTLLSYFLNCTDDKRIKRVFRLADFSRRDEFKRLLADDMRNAEDRLLEALGLRKEELCHSILMLDGLDEITLEGTKRAEFLNQLAYVFDEIEGFTWIVTCRTNYIDISDEKLNIRHAELDVWNEKEIEAYINLYASMEGLQKDYSKLIQNAQKNSEVLGIKLILYMVLATGIAVEKDASLVEVYDRIFDLEQGGIYEKVIDDQKWDRYPNATVKERKELIHKISQEIAFWMFENNADGASIPKEIYQEVLRKHGDTYGAFGIGSYFQQIQHTEGTNEMCFVHRSMYEYFAVEYLIWSLKEVLKEADQEHPFGKKEDFCKKLAFWGKRGKVWDGDGNKPLIYQFLEAKVRALVKDKTLLPRGLKDIYVWFEEGIIELFNKGTIAYAYMDSNTRECKNSLSEDIKCGQTLLLILNIVYNVYNPSYEYEDHLRIFENVREKVEGNKNFERYLRSIANDGNVFRLRGVNLYSLDFGSVNLNSAKLISANLNEANLSSANLSSSYLYEADLSSAKLISANLSEANLISANLKLADFREANLRGAKLISANLSSAKLISANLSEANLISANLNAVDLISTNLREADLRSANLRSADLRSADLNSADLRRAYLRSAYLKSANLERARLTYYSYTGEKNFPIKSIGTAKFETIFVDDVKYTRKDFFKKFQPGTDKLGECEIFL